MPTTDKSTHHPADRPLEPDHPMMLKGDVVPGDAAIMFRCMVEELLQVGIAPEELARMSRDANYQALYAARRSLGDEVVDRLLAETLARVGRHRHRTSEHTGDVQSVSLTVNASRSGQ